MNNFYSNDDFITDDDEGIKKSSITPSHALTTDEVLSGWCEDIPNASTQHTSALDSLKNKMMSSAAGGEEKTEEAEIQAPEKTLLEKLKRYTIDDQGHDVSKNTAPLYKLKSVAEILKNDGEKTLESLSRMYDVSIDDLGKPKKTEEIALPEEIPQETEDNTEETPSPTPAFEKMVLDSEARFEEKIRKDVLGEDEAEDILPEDISLPHISDTDTLATGVVDSSSKISDTATIRFTPINTGGSKSHISVSSTTRQIDIKSELTETEDEESKPQKTELQQSEFELYKPEDEVVDAASCKLAIRGLAFKKRSAFLRMTISGIFTFVLLLFTFPPLSELMISNADTVLTVCTVLFFACAITSIDAFVDFVNLFKGKCSHDILLSFALSICSVLAITALTTHNDAFYILLICSVCIFTRNLSQFIERSAKLGNLRQAASPKQKTALSLIDDSSVTFAMAKNSIEGDVLAAAPRKTDFLKDFMKYSTYGAKLLGRINIVFIITVILSVLSFIAALVYYDGVFFGLLSAAVVALSAAMPVLFLIDALPIYSAAKRLNKRGAMLAGKAAAEQLEFVNAAVLSTEHIFPEGTITLHDMKVLSENNIDKTILMAAALTEALRSPLCPIFKKIAGTNASYNTELDTKLIKYEEKLGVSGWVDNKMLFIGNRTLMEAHGIDVPSIEVDRRILRNGFFPVYVATEGKAYALLIIQYSVNQNIAKELRRISKLGVTLLVDNSDPNINEQMLCDYFGLYEDSVKVMTNAGVHMYKNATAHTESCSAPALYHRAGLDMVRIINCASRIKKSNVLLTVIYSIASILTALYFIYNAFSGTSAMPAASTVLLFEAAALAVALIAFLFKRP